MKRNRGQLFNVCESDRMYGTKKVVAARVIMEEARWIHMLRFLANKANDPWMMASIEAQITERWGRDV